MGLISSVASPTSPNNRFRKGRFALFRSIVDRILAERGTCRIVDIGGTVNYWIAFGSDLLADTRVSVVTVNLCHDNEALKNDLERVEVITGNACQLDTIADKAFDLAHSNSVIEHVGRWNDMRDMASEVRRVAHFHFVQTPYWGFPIEPHNRTALFHWLPEQFRYRLIMRRSRGFWQRATSVDQAMQMVQSNSLMDRRQFGALFPTSSIYSEIVYGLTKSLIAVGGEGVPVDVHSNTRRLRV